MKPIRVLMIEDNEDDALLIKEFMDESELSTNLQWADRLEKGLTVLSQENIDVVLLDLGLPGIQNLEAFEQVSGKAPHIPIIILTGHADQEAGIEAISRGAQDYLIKGQINSHLLSRSIQYAIERKRIEEALRVSETRERRVNQKLRRTVNELKEANRKILENQKSAIEEERLKAILEMSSTTAHEMNQPLTSLLGNIELMKSRKNDPEKLTQHIDVIERSGRRIADIVKKINALRHDEKKPYIGDSFIINIHQKINLLSVEDSEYDFELVQNLLKGDDMINLSRALSIEEAMKLLEEKKFDLIILDHLLPDGNGLDFFKLMKKKEIEIPVVVNTAHGDEIIASKFIKEGAYDYINKKNISKKSLYRSINNALEKFRLKKEIKLAWEKMAKMATRDELTGLYNRRYFMEIVDREVDRTKRYNTRLVLCMISVDHFKKINDTHGPLAGDMVLFEIGKILIKGIRLSDLVCRYGDEKFAAILPNTGIEDAALVCERFRKLISERQFEYKSARFKVTISIGIAVFDRDSDQSSAHLLEKANQSLYEAKGNKFLS